MDIGAETEATFENPLIPNARLRQMYAAMLRARSFTLDGEAVVCGADGIAVFEALHRHGTGREAILQVFDLLKLDREDPPAVAL